ncbi:MAG: hypothetical protein V3V21_06040 [Thermoplasmata archaeon]
MRFWKPKLLISLVSSPHTEMRTYITLCGRRSWALVNSLWASIEDHDYLPEKLIILHHARLKEDAHECSGPAEELLRSYGVEPEVSVHVVPETDFINRVAEKVAEIIKEEKKKGNEVALDITPARKALALPAYTSALNHGADHVFYLFLRDLRHANRPYPMIPYFLHDWRDFVRKGDD